MSGISEFKRINKIGQGAFGIAWLVESKIDFNKYVIKEIGLYKMNEKERCEAKKEVLLLSKMNHPNIVAYYKSFEEAGCFHIMMEYCEGGDLYCRIKAQNGVLFKEDQILDYFIQICLALKHIHDQKILHRDIKPQNVFLTKYNSVKLGDFGIAKAMNSTTALTKTTVGTPFYFSPEICEGRPYNNKSDIWSLGCILYELCSLKYAFFGQDMAHLAMQIKRVNYNPVSILFSAPLRTLIDNMFRRRPDERPNINNILRKPFILKRLDKYLPPESTMVLEAKKIQKRPSTANVVSRVDSGLSNKKKNRIGKEFLIINSPYAPSPIRNANDKRTGIKINKPEEIKPNPVVAKQHELVNKMKVDRINNDRENGWKNVINSDELKSGDKEPKIDIKPNLYVDDPSAIIKQKIHSPAYDLYYAELDRIKENQRLRERENKILMQLNKNNDNKVDIKGQNYLDGIYRKHEVCDVNILRGKVKPSDNALVVQEYLDRKRQAQNIKYRDGSGMAMVMGGGPKFANHFPAPKQTPRNVEEEMSDRLNKIRQKNSELNKYQNFEDYLKKNDADNNVNFNQQEARKTIEELQKKLKQRTEDLKQKLEKKEKEKIHKDEDDRMNVILFPKRNIPVVHDAINDQPSSPAESSSISVILEKLNQESPRGDIPKQCEKNEPVDSQPSLSVIFSQLEEKPSRPSTACNSEQSEIRKMKDDILKRLNTKSSIMSNELEINDKVTPVRKSWIFDKEDEHIIFENPSFDTTCDTFVDVSFLSHDENDKMRGKWKFEDDLQSDTMILKNIKVGVNSNNSEFDGSTITLDGPTNNSVDLPTISENIDHINITLDEPPNINVDLPKISEDIDRANIALDDTSTNLSTILELTQEITEIELPENQISPLKLIQKEEVWTESNLKVIVTSENESDSKNTNTRKPIDLQHQEEILVLEDDVENENIEDGKDSYSSGSDGEEELIECLNNVLSLNFSVVGSPSLEDDEREDLHNKTITSSVFYDNFKLIASTSLNDISQKPESKIRRIKSDGELNRSLEKDSLSEDIDEFSSEDFGDEEAADAENIFLKIEKIRIELEKKIGIDPLIDIIEFIRENQDLNGDELVDSLKKMITDDGSINDILHLVVLEKQYHNIE